MATTNTAIPALPPTVSPQKPQQAPQQRATLSDYSLEALIELRRKIDELLPSLRGVNMERELVAQLAVVKKLQDEVIDDEQTPANQRAQVAGQVANILATLGRLQVEVYDSERLKKIEEILIDTIKELPTAQQEAFLTAYEAKLS